MRENNEFQEFYLNNNSIKKLPSTLCSLQKLQVLDVSNNALRVLPDNMGSLVSLQHLNISGNKVQQLPKSICHAQRLSKIVLDTDNCIYPPRDIVEQGTEVIMKFICDGESYF